MERDRKQVGTQAARRRLAPACRPSRAHQSLRSKRSWLVLVAAGDGGAATAAGRAAATALRRWWIDRSASGLPERLLLVLHWLRLATCGAGRAVTVRPLAAAEAWHGLAMALRCCTVYQVAEGPEGSLGGWRTGPTRGCECPRGWRPPTGPLLLGAPQDGSPRCQEVPVGAMGAPVRLTATCRRAGARGGREAPRDGLGPPHAPVHRPPEDIPIPQRQPASCAVPRSALLACSEGGPAGITIQSSTLPQP